MNTNRNTILVVVGVILAGWLLMMSPANKDAIKANAVQTWSQAGYEVIGYEGFQWGKWWGGKYGGACVWYSLERQNNGIIYTGCIKRWGEEYHIYGPRAIDAIKP